MAPVIMSALCYFYSCPHFINLSAKWPDMDVLLPPVDHRTAVLKVSGPVNLRSVISASVGRRNM